MKFSFGYPTSGTVFHRFADCVGRMMIFECMSSSRKLGSFLGSRQGCMVARNRGDIVRDFLEQVNDDYLLMIDPDIEFKFDIMFQLDNVIKINKLLGTDIDILAARVNVIPGDPVFFNLNNKGEARPFQEDFAGIKEFYAVGFGIICLSRTVLKDMHHQLSGSYHMFNSIVDHGEISTDDFGFCHLARSMNYKIYGTCDIRGNHWKPQPINDRILF